MLRMLAVAILVSLAALWTPTEVRAQTSGAQTSPPRYIVTGEDYFLKEGDVIEVTVREDPNLNRRLMIGPDGKINMTLAGVILARGQTVEAVQSDIFRRLKSQFVSDPTVTVSLVALAESEETLLPEEVELMSVFVTGEVVQDGRFEVEGPVSVLQAIALAGGLGDFAAKRRIQVRRRDGGREIVQQFNYEEVESGEALDSNIDLVDGDNRLRSAQASLRVGEGSPRVSSVWASRSRSRRRSTRSPNRSRKRTRPCRARSSTPIRPG